MAGPQADILLYMAALPNGHKIPCQLEGLGVKYEAKTLNLDKNEQKEEWFLKINRTDASFPHKHKALVLSVDFPQRTAASSKVALSCSTCAPRSVQYPSPPPCSP